MTLSETELTQQLDTRDLLTDAHDPGVYGIEVSVPDTLDTVRRQWDAAHDARPDGDALARLASAPKVAYVGAAKDVYARLSDHVTGERRTTAFLAAFEPVDIVDIWPHLDPFTAEYNRAVRLARGDWACWCDGSVLG
jgi:hypothetical protein